ncbi:unnamed protein product [Phytophthora fragariaefolia]|uniref:Unnamed protein product n=1 Tax=Phytophthora fragariaefolia TaxID=1490495 RepID=A0A9W6XLI2_9STRA|nr:unnamed protein product [Phytophthora fragariaefolia]
MEELIVSNPALHSELALSKSPSLRGVIIRFVIAALTGNAESVAHRKNATSKRAKSLGAIDTVLINDVRDLNQLGTKAELSTDQTGTNQSTCRLLPNPGRDCQSLTGHLKGKIHTGTRRGETAWFPHVLYEQFPCIRHLDMSQRDINKLGYSTCAENSDKKQQEERTVNITPKNAYPSCVSTLITSGWRLLNITTCGWGGKTPDKVSVYGLAVIGHGVVAEGVEVSGSAVTEAGHGVVAAGVLAGSVVSGRDVTGHGVVGAGVLVGAEVSGSEVTGHGVGAEVSGSEVTGHGVVEAGVDTGASVSGSDVTGHGVAVGASVSGSEVTGHGVVGASVSGREVTGQGVVGASVSGNGVTGHGVSGSDVTGHGVSGSDVTGHGVSGSEVTGHGVSGSDVTGQGVSGREVTGHGVSGSEVTGHGVSGSDVTGQGVSGSEVTGHGVLAVPHPTDGSTQPQVSPLTTTHSASSGATQALPFQDGR